MMRNFLKTLTLYDFCFFILILASVFIRIPTLNMPLTGFRQTQTAITVQTYIDEGVSVFKYKTPVLGSPWTVPFEFPAYQISAYVLYKAANIFFSLDLNAALRLTNIIYFYACAFFLFLISKRLFSNAAISKTATLIFLLFPFGIYWSSTSSIEFAADFFSLGYVYFFTLFLDKPAKENFKVFFAALLFGTFGYLTKITTIFPYCIFLAFIIVERFRKTKFSQLSVYIQILALIAVPLIIGIVWTKWTDHIKIISGISALSSQNLQQWNFGTLHQKLSFENWRFIYDSMKKMGINPAVFCAVLLFIPIFLKRKEEFLRALIAIFCSMAAFLVFFNLYYVHDYYYCAILPFLCMFGGYVLYYLISQIQSFFNAESVKKTIAIFCSLALLSIFLYNDPYIKKTFKDAQYFKEYKGKLLTLTGYIKTHSRKSDLIMVFDNDWNSEIPYNAQRKAVMVCWINESSYFKTANDYELFIMNKNSQLKDERIVKLKNIAFEISIGDWDVYRKKK